MFRLFECCALSFFERFVLSFSLKIERFVSDSAEIWICGLYIWYSIIYIFIEKKILSIFIFLEKPWFYILIICFIRQACIFVPFTSKNTFATNIMHCCMKASNTRK